MNEKSEEDQMLKELGHSKPMKPRDYLHMLYKKYKVGLITEADLSSKEKALLKKYYGL